MKRKSFRLSIVCVLLIAPYAFGQSPTGKNDPQQGYNIYDKPPAAANLDRQRQKMDERHGRDRNGMMIAPRVERKPRRAPGARTAELENAANRQAALKRLQAPAIYYQKYASLLKNNKFTLARLFVDRNCDAGKTVTVEELERCGDFIPVKGGGAFYSFRTRTNKGYQKDWWDAHFIDGKLKVGNDSVQSIVAEIGDVEPEIVKLNSAPIEFLKKYKAKESFIEIAEQNKVLQKGIVFKNYIYSNTIAAKPSSTYVLRSIAYRLEDESVFSDEIGQDAAGSGRGKDVTAVFKIVGLESDGSLILLWKELKTDLPRRRLK